MRRGALDGDVSRPTPARRPRTPWATTDAAVIESEDAVQALLDALKDADCRRILEATADATLSAKEVAAACDLPLSTVYRKLERLTTARLVEEGVRFDGPGKHASEYARLVEDVSFSLDVASGLSCAVSYRKPVEREPWLQAC